MGKFDGFVPADVPRPVSMDPTPYGTLEPKANVDAWRMKFGSLQMRVKDNEKRLRDQELYVIKLKEYCEMLQEWIEARFTSTETVHLGINHRLTDLEKLTFEHLKESDDVEASEDFEEPYDDRSAPRDFDSQKYE